jgi:HK97 family phage major capsid protein
VNIKDQRAAALSAAKTIALKAKAEGRDFTPAESAEVDQHLAKADELGKHLDAAAKAADTMARIGALNPGDLGEDGTLFSEADAKGFLHAARTKTSFGTTVRYKAAMTEGDLLPSVGNAVVNNPDPKAGRALRDLFTAAPASGPTVRYYTLGEADSTLVEIVPEDGLKPEINVTYAPVDAELVKLATRFSLTDELSEDAPFLVREIQSAVLRAVLVRENKLVIDTIDATSGILTGTSTAATMIDLLASEIGASEAINGETPTALVVNPVDLAAVRVAKASTGGSYFIDPLSSGPTSIHGVPLIPTAATAAGTAYLLTSGFGTFYSRGSLRVEAGFTGDDWIHNRMTIRAEERVLPVVNRPNLVTKLTLT